MATTAQATDVLQALEGHALFATQVAFKGEGFGGSAQFLHVGVAQVLDADVWIDTALGQDLAGTGETDAIDVGERDLDPLVTRDIDTGDPSHFGETIRGAGGPP